MSQRTTSVRSDLGENLLAAFYLLLEHDGLLDVLWYERTPTLREFLGWHDRPNAAHFGAFVSNVGRTELAGIGWLWDIKGPDGGRRANVDIVFLRKFQARGLTLDLTRQMIDLAFTKFGIDVLYGITPTINHAAQRLARQLGFTLVGPLPKWGVCRGKVGDAVMTHLTKERWEAARGMA